MLVELVSPELVTHGSAKKASLDISGNLRLNKMTQMELTAKNNIVRTQPLVEPHLEASEVLRAAVKNSSNTNSFFGKNIVNAHKDKIRNVQTDMNPKINGV